MGFLEKIWDETLAGPPPDSGLGKLRKYNSYSGSVVTPPVPVDDPSFPISRSITILRSNPVQILNVNVSVDSGGSIPSSPAASSSVPTTPQSPSTPSGNFKRLTRRKSTPAALPQGEPRNPSGYDWCFSPPLSYLFNNTFLILTH